MKWKFSIFVAIAASIILMTDHYEPDTTSASTDNHQASPRYLHAAETQEPVGQTKQAIISGRLADPATQEEYGLLTLSTPTSGCSASLLTNDWVITAAHCLIPADMNNPSQVTLTANWKSVQSQQGMAIRSFGPQTDIALIRVRRPFSVHGNTSGYRRRVAWEEDYYRLTTFGRGIFALAQGSGATATPSQSDGQYRLAVAQVNKLEQNLYWYSPEASQITAGGDSGGPSFSHMYTTGPILVGVHSKCTRRCLPGQMCPTGSWTWVSEILRCADAPVYMIGAEISKTLATPHPLLETRIQGEAKTKPNPATTRSGDTVYGPLSPPGAKPSPDPGCTAKKPYSRCNAFGHCYCSDVRPPVVVN